MTTPTSILDSLDQLGISIRVDGGDLVLRPRHQLDGELLAAVRQHKDRLVQLVGDHDERPYLDRLTSSQRRTVDTAKGIFARWDLRVVGVMEADK